MKVKNLPLYAFVGVMVLFTIGYFISAYNISFAFPTGEENISYDNKINLIKKAAELYGENNPDRFIEDDYITVDELIRNGYLFADNEDGEFKDPTSEVKTLNETRIRVSTKNGSIEATVLID